MAEQPQQSSTTVGAEQMRFAPGHELHPIRQRAAMATASGWRDAVVAGVDGQVATFVAFDTGEALTVWHHVSLEHELVVGTPVALHKSYDVLTVGEGLYISVLPLP